MSLSGNIIVIVNFQLKASSELGCDFVIQCYGVTKDPNQNDHLLLFEYARKGDLHNNLSKNFKEITWRDKILSLYWISAG